MAKLLLVIGNKNYSTWSLRPWIYLKQAGIDFDEKRIPLDTDQTAAQVAPYFSGGKVPVLVDGDLKVWDSLAILEYAAEKYPRYPGWPADSAARAVARCMSAEMHSSFPALRSALPMNCRRQFDYIEISAEVQADIDRILMIWNYAHTRYSQTGPWLFGDFTIADAMYAPVVMRFSGYNVPLDGYPREYVQTMLDHPHLQAWIAAGKQEKEVLIADEIDL